MSTPVSVNSSKTTLKSITERIFYETTVKFQLLEQSVLSGNCKDLSIGGLYLATNFPLDFDENLVVSFSIPSKERSIHIECKARVAWTNFSTNRRKPVYPKGVGLQFLSLVHDDLSVLSKFIDNYDEHKKMNVVCAWCGHFLGMRKGPIGTTSHGICDQCHNRLYSSP